MTEAFEPTHNLDSQRADSSNVLMGTYVISAATQIAQIATVAVPIECIKEVTDNTEYDLLVHVYDPEQDLN